jgi:biotin carboxyl carrier protein
MLRENGLEVNDENVFIAATCKEKGIIYLTGNAKVTVRKTKKKKQDTSQAAAAVVHEKPEGLRSFDVYVDDEYFKVEINEPDGMPYIAGGIANRNPYRAPAVAGAASGASSALSGQSGREEIQVKEGETAVHAPLPGIIIKYEKKLGDMVKVGDTVAIVEAMKMNNNIDAPIDGKIVKIPHKAGSNIAKGEILCIIKGS